MDRFISIPVILNMAKDPSSSSSSEDERKSGTARGRRRRRRRRRRRARDSIKIDGKDRSITNYSGDNDDDDEEAAAAAAVVDKADTSKNDEMVNQTNMEIHSSPMLNHQIPPDCDVNLKSNNQPISNNDVTSDDILLDKKPIKVENDPPLTVEEAAEILLSLSLK